ncbi:MAG TPA: hypothetical protein VF009_06960 [Solirubrobacterales bacterium]
MRLTEVAENTPRNCAVTGRDDGPFIDFQKVIDSPLPTHLYLHVLIVEEAAKRLGMVPAKDVEKLRADLAEMSGRIDEVNEILQTAGELEELLNRHRQKERA